VCKALDEDFWVSKINTQEGLSVDHIQQFYKLWEMLANVLLDNESEDSITWKFTNNGCYSAKSAYNMQFLGLTTSTMPTFVWKSWAPQKCKTFTWLILQNRVWTADRLEKRGRPNCGLCKLCNQVQESTAPIFYHCRFTIRVWTVIISWLGLHEMDTQDWHAIESVKDWWAQVIHKR
jgi:hypothetical protein